MLLKVGIKEECFRVVSYYTQNYTLKSQFCMEFKLNISILDIPGFHLDKHRGS